MVFLFDGSSAESESVIGLGEDIREETEKGFYFRWRKLPRPHLSASSAEKLQDFNRE